MEVDITYRDIKQLFSIILLFILVRFILYIIAVYLSGGTIQDITFDMSSFSLNVSFIDADFGFIKYFTLILGWLIPSVSAVAFSRMCNKKYFRYGSLVMMVYGIVVFIPRLSFMPSEIYGSMDIYYYMLMTLLILCTVIILNIAIRGKVVCKPRGELAY